MAKSKPAPLKTKGAAPSCRERRSYVSWPAGCQSSGKEGGLKRGLHGKVKTRTLKDEGCGTQLQGEEKLRVVAGGLPEFGERGRPKAGLTWQSQNPHPL